MLVEVLPNCDPKLTLIDFPRYTSDRTKALSCLQAQSDAAAVSRKLDTGIYYQPSTPASFQLLPGHICPGRSPDLSSPIWSLGP
jgi:hypothetical protein